MPVLIRTFLKNLMHYELLSLDVYTIFLAAQQWSQLYHEASLIINAKEKKKQQDKLADNIERVGVLYSV